MGAEFAECPRKAPTLVGAETQTRGFFTHAKNAKDGNGDD